MPSIIRGAFFTSSASGLFFRLLKGIIFGILNTGLILALLAEFLSGEFINQFSGLMQDIFMSQTARFIWLFLPVVMVLFFMKRRRGPGRPSFGY